SVVCEQFPAHGIGMRSNQKIRQHTFFLPAASPIKAKSLCRRETGLPWKIMSVRERANPFFCLFFGFRQRCGFGKNDLIHEDTSRGSKFFQSGEQSHRILLPGQDGDDDGRINEMHSLPTQQFHCFLIGGFSFQNANRKFVFLRLTGRRCRKQYIARKLTGVSPVLSRRLLNFFEFTIV
ncbi:MAG TPA: hypothetical protein VFW05_12940, partial [Verrucomicrobiae bacterium]|nr:hypothetical protein [Verrucomicrobiae bacterium]